MIRKNTHSGLIRQFGEAGQWWAARHTNQLGDAWVILPTARGYVVRRVAVTLFVFSFLSVLCVCFKFLDIVTLAFANAVQQEF